MLVIHYGLRAELKVFKLCLLSACYIAKDWRSLTFVVGKVFVHISVWNRTLSIFPAFLVLGIQHVICQVGIIWMVSGTSAAAPGRQM